MPLPSSHVFGLPHFINPKYTPLHPPPTIIPLLPPLIRWRPTRLPLDPPPGQLDHVQHRLLMNRLGYNPVRASRHVFVLILPQRIAGAADDKDVLACFSDVRGDFDPRHERHLAVRQSSHSYHVQYARRPDGERWLTCPKRRYHKWAPILHLQSCPSRGREPFYHSRLSLLDARVE